MTREIQPISRPLMTQSCPNNTYWGIQAMDTRINTYQFSRNTCHSPVDANDNVKLEKLNRQARILQQKVATAIEDLWRLHHKVSRYENTDDDFAARAKTLHARFAGPLGHMADEYAWVFGGVGNFFLGIIGGLQSIGLACRSLVGMVVLIPFYQWGKLLGNCPDWLDNIVGGGWRGIWNFITDPAASCKGLIRGFVYDFEENPAYAVGTLAPDIASFVTPGGVALKATKVARAARLTNKPPTVRPGGAGVVFGSCTKSKDKLFRQMSARGWTESSVRDVISNPHTTRVSTNLSTGNSATVYYNRAGGHVIVDDITREIVHVSDNINPSTWLPDVNIVNPYRP